MQTFDYWPTEFEGGDSVINGEGGTYLSFTDPAARAIVRIHFNAESGAQFLQWIDAARAAIAGRGPVN